MLNVKNFSVYTHDKKLAGPVDFELKKGQLLAISGRNGSGKTSLIRGLLGLIDNKGKIVYEGQEVNRIPAQAVGYVPQKFHFPGILPVTVREFFSFSNVGMPTTDLCSELDISKLMNQPLAVLSGGELQRVILARALVRHPELLILDEASAGIDDPSRKKISELLLHLMDDHEATIIMITHDHDELKYYQNHLKTNFHELALS